MKQASLVFLWAIRFEPLTPQCPVWELNPRTQRPLVGRKGSSAGGRNQTGALPGVDSRVLTPHVLGIGGVSSYSLHY